MRLDVAAATPLLRKTLVFSTDEAPRIDRDLEGLALLSPRELLLVNDNDFGVEGTRTRFWRVTFRQALSSAHARCIGVQRAPWGDAR